MKRRPCKGKPFLFRRVWRPLEGKAPAAAVYLQHPLAYTKGTPHTAGLCGESLYLLICDLWESVRQTHSKSNDLLAFVQPRLAEDGPFGNVYRVVAQPLQVFGNHEQIQHIIRILGVLGQALGQLLLGGVE